jgi:ketosteroid isomerase-like protein
VSVNDKPEAVAESNQRLAIAFLDALGSGDAAAMRATLADDAALLLPRPTFTGTEIRGAEAIATSMAELGAHYASPEGILGPIVASATTVIAEWRLKATIIASGAPYDQFYVWALTCANGRITELREYQDTRYGFEVMGALSQDTLDTHVRPSS